MEDYIEICKMDDFEPSVADFDKEIDQRNLNVKDLEISIWINKLKISNKENHELMEKLENKENEVQELRDKLRYALKTLSKNQVKLKESIPAKDYPENVDFPCKIKYRHKDLFDSHEMRLSDRNDVLENRFTGDPMLSELSSKLYQNEAVLVKINSSHHHLESSIKRQSKLLEEKDGQLLDQTEKVEQTLNTLCKTEIKSNNIIASLQTSNQILEAHVEKYEFKRKHLEKLLECQKRELKHTKELLDYAVKEKNEHAKLLHRALIEKADKVYEANQMISSLQMKLQNLEKVTSQTREKNELINNAVDENGAQLVKKEYELNLALEALHEAESNLVDVKTSLQSRNQKLEKNVKDLKYELNSSKTEMNERHDILEKKLKEKENQLSELKYHLNQKQNQVHEKELRKTIISLQMSIYQLEDGKREHDLKVERLEKKLDTANMKLRDTTKLSVNNLVKESQLSDLQNTLKQRKETKLELGDVITSQRSRIHDLEKQNQYLTTKTGQHCQTIKSQDEMIVRYKDKVTDISKQNDQLNHTLNTLHEAESESSNTLVLLERKRSGLEADIECRNLKIKHLTEQVDKMEVENRSGNELHAKHIVEMEKRLLEQKDKLQHVVSKSQEKEAKLGSMISSLTEQNQFLEKQVQSCVLNVKRLERLLDNKDTALGHANKVAMEKDDRLSELGAYPQQTKEYKAVEIDFTHINQQESGRERIQRNDRHLEEEMNSENPEISQMSDTMELEGMNEMKKNDDTLRAKDDQIKILQERETEHTSNMSALQIKFEDLQAEIKLRDVMVKDLEETLDHMKTAISEGNELLEMKMMEKEKQLSNQRDQFQEALNKSVNKEFKLNDIITSLKDQTQVKEGHICELKSQLEQALETYKMRSVEIEKNENSQNSRIKLLEAEVKRLNQNAENLKEKLKSEQADMNQIMEINANLKNEMKDKDKHNDQLNSSFKTLQGNEKEFGAMIISLKNDNQVLENKNELLDQKVKDFEKRHDNMMKEFRKKCEHFERQLNEKEKQLSEQRDQLQQALHEVKEKETEINNITDLQSKQNTEKEDQVADLRAQLRQTSNNLEGKKAEIRDIDISMMNEIKRLQSEVEEHKLSISHLKDTLSKTEVDLRQLLERNELLDSVVKGKDNKIHEQSDKLTLTQKKLQETDNELKEIITSLKEKVHGLEIDIEHRNVQIHDLTKKLKGTETNKSSEIEDLTEKTNQLSEENSQLQQALNLVHKSEAKSKDINTSLQKQNQERDDHISELRYQIEHVLKQLNDKDAEMEKLEKKVKSLETVTDRREQKLIQLEEMVSSKKVEIGRLTDINRLLEKEKKEIDFHFHEKIDQLRQEKQQNDKLNRILKTLQENEKESDRMITSLKKNNQLLQKNIERRDHEIKEISCTNAHFDQQLNDKEKQLSDQRTQLHRALNQIKEQEIKINDFKILQKKESKERDDKISHLRAKLQENSKDLEGKMAELKEIEISLNKEIKRLVSEVEHRQQNISRLEENLSSKRVEIDRLKNISKHLENKIQDDNAQAREQIHQLQHEIQNLQREVERRDLKLKDLDKMLHKKIETGKKEEDKDVRDKEQKIADLKDQLRKTSVKLHDTEAELEETKTRLSKAMGDRLTDNNPNITDLSDRNRPTKLAERCAELYDNQWTDAFDILDKYFDTEEIVIDALLRILQDAMTFCIAQAREQMRALGRELKFAGQHEREDVSADVLKHFKDSRKSVASVAVGNLYKMFVSHLKRSTDKTLRSALEVSPYTSECLEICWLMVIQDPPVAFAPLVRKGSSFNTDLYKPYTTSGTLISYVVWPPLLLHDGGPILAKGVAQGYAKKQKGSTM